MHEQDFERDWRRAVMLSLHDPMVIFDADGLVLEMNQAFTDLLGYSLDDGPLVPPYPWWPSEAEDAAAREAIVDLHAAAEARHTVDAEVVFYTKDRRRLWVHSVDSVVDEPGTVNARIRVLRDVTREKQAQTRRAAAARVSAEFGGTDDLATLLGVAEHGFGLLFDGTTTLALDLDEGYYFSAGIVLAADDLPDAARAGLRGRPSADTASLRPGILLVPGTSSVDARAWVQFPVPRRIGIDEMIAADLLAQGFGLAVDRLVSLQQAADREANMRQAVESHRLIGQAVGILVERHRLSPADAFAGLKEASQNRNLKLREIAARVIESGEEPAQA